MSATKVASTQAERTALVARLRHISKVAGDNDLYEAADVIEKLGERIRKIQTEVLCLDGLFHCPDDDCEDDHWDVASGVAERILALATEGDAVPPDDAATIIEELEGRIAKLRKGLGATMSGEFGAWHAHETLLADEPEPDDAPVKRA